jgi:hypothetical protein
MAASVMAGKNYTAQTAGYLGYQNEKSHISTISVDNSLGKCLTTCTNPACKGAGLVCVVIRLSGMTVNSMG